MAAPISPQAAPERAPSCRLLRELAALAASAADFGWPERALAALAGLRPGSTGGLWLGAGDDARLAAGAESSPEDAVAALVLPLGSADGELGRVELRPAPGEPPFDAGERELLQAGTALLAGLLRVRRASDERLRDGRAGLDLIDSSADGIVALDGEGRVRIWNRGAERLFGRRREDAQGRTPEEIFGLEPLFRPGSEGRFDERRIVVRDQERIVNVSVGRLPAAPGEGPGTGAIVRDVTDTVRLRRTLEHSERLSQLGKMAAGIAHEVGNPLAGISSLVQTLLARLKADEAAVERLKLVKTQVGRINLIIRQLVDYSRPVPERRRRCDFNELIREAARLARYDERSRGVDLTLELDDRLPAVEAVPHQVQQVFVNLIHNALDATEGRTYRAVRVRSRRLEGGGAEFGVEDNGCGIAPKDLERVFDPFFTTKEPGRGTGLGLWICRGIVQALPGELDVHSQPDKGTRVTLRVEEPCPSRS